MDRMDEIALSTLNDALMCLRMTEDVLKWVKERLKSYQINNVNISV